MIGVQPLKVPSTYTFAAGRALSRNCPNPRLGASTAIRENSVGLRASKPFESRRGRLPACSVAVCVAVASLCFLCPLLPGVAAGRMNFLPSFDGAFALRTVGDMPETLGAFDVDVFAL